MCSSKPTISRFFLPLYHIISYPVSYLSLLLISSFYLLHGSLIFFKVSEFDQSPSSYYLQKHWFTSLIWVCMKIGYAKTGYHGWSSFSFIKRAILLHTLYCSCVYPHIPGMVREHPQHHIPATLPSKSHDINPMKSPHDFPMVIYSFFWVRWSKGHQLHSFHRRRGRLGHCTGAGTSHGILPANTHGRRPWRRGPKIVDFWWEKCVMFDEIIVLWIIKITEHTGKKTS